MNFGAHDAYVACMYVVHVATFFTPGDFQLVDFIVNAAWCIINQLLFTPLPCFIAGL